MTTHIDEPAAFLLKGPKAYRIKACNQETGRLDLETEFGVELVATVEKAEANGYTATQGFVRKLIEGTRVVHYFVDTQGRRFDGK